jgi:hypothetical protein
MKLLKVLGMAMALVLGLATLARAEPLALNQVATDAKWVIHVDVDALWASTVVQNAYHKCMTMHKDAEKKADLVCDIIGMDPRKDLHGVTVYGKDTDEKHGVMIVYANVNKKLLLDLVAIAPDHQSSKYGSYELHSWTPKCEKKHPHTVTGAFYKPNILVFGGSAEAVKAALDVLDGKSAGISSSESPLAGPTQPGSILVVRTSVIDPKIPCPVLKQTESFRIALGENSGESFYRSHAVMKSTEPVQQIKSIAEGFKALVALKHGTDADAMKLVSGLKVTGEGTNLDISWSASAADVWTAIEKAGQKWAEHKDKGKAHGHAACPGTAAGKCPMGDSHKSKPQSKHSQNEF